ncbi:MAG: lipoyl synthase [Bacteroidota bacterium]|nr:lipoyl synthase [Bacteroidota bacterium]
MKQNSRIKPDWLKIRLPLGENVRKVNGIIKKHKLHTICTSGSCPNQAECWGNGTATFMILGDICTRACRFCDVKTGKPNPVDLLEPERIAKSISLLKLKHAVITSVDRDDLKDGGASIWAETIRQIKDKNPGLTMEALIPDFDGNKENIRQIIDAGPEVLSHNLETVRRLTPEIRTKAKYDISLKVLEYISQTDIVCKSGIMLGLGETEEEILHTMDDLREVGVSVMTIGQYLQPTKKHIEVKEYIHPDIFRKYEVIGLKKGFRYVESGPLIRSSYHAEKHVR